MIIKGFKKAQRSYNQEGQKLYDKDGENVIPCPCIICKVIASKPRIWKDIKIFFV